MEQFLAFVKKKLTTSFIKLFFSFGSLTAINKAKAISALSLILVYLFLFFKISVTQIIN